MNESFIRLKDAIRDVLLNIMILPGNKFDKREYFILSQLLWAVDNYPNFTIPFTCFGMLTRYDGCIKELAICFDNSILELKLDGIEKTQAGSDSFDKIHLRLGHDDVARMIKEGSPIDLQDLETWYSESKQLLIDSVVEFTFEYYG